MKVTSEVAQRCLTLCDPTDQAPQSMEFSRQEYCSGLPFPSPGDLPNIVWRFLKKLKLELSYGRTIPLLGINPEKNMI